MSIFKRLLELAPCPDSKRVVYYLQQELIEHFDADVEFKWDDWKPDPEKKDRDEGYVARFYLDGVIGIELWIWPISDYASLGGIGLFIKEGDKLEGKGTFDLNLKGADDLIRRLYEYQRIYKVTKDAQDAWMSR